MAATSDINKASEEHAAVYQAYSQNLIDLEKALILSGRIELSTLEEDVADMFLAQLLHKRATLLKMQGDWPKNQLDQPIMPIQELLENIKST